MKLTKELQYSDTYNLSHPVYDAPIIDITIYKPPFNKITIHKSKKVRFCLDTGADMFATVPDYILTEKGIDTGQEILVQDYQGNEKIQQVYAIGLTIEDINVNQIIEAIPTKKDFGLLPRKILNEWKILLDSPNRKFSITTDY